MAEPASFVHTGQRQKKSTDKPMNFTPLPKPPPSGEVARRSRDGEGAFGTNPLSRLRRQLSRGGEPLAEPASFVHTGQRQKKSTDKPINFTPLPKPPPSGEVARRSRDGEGCFQDEPSQSPAATALPKGRALGRTSKFRPHQSTVRRNQLISGKLYAPAKAFPFRERWHGEAVMERVCFRNEPSQSPTATALPKGEPLAKPVGFVLVSQRLE